MAGIKMEMLACSPELATRCKVPEHALVARVKVTMVAVVAGRESPHGVLATVTGIDNRSVTALAATLVPTGAGADGTRTARRSRVDHTLATETTMRLVRPAGRVRVTSGPWCTPTATVPPDKSHPAKGPPPEASARTR
jgi:hypothetical protein